MFKDITGQRFGRLVAIQRVENSTRDQAYWLCRCDCKNTCTIKSGNLRSNNTRSCGCLKKENRGLPKHGYARHEKRHPLYNIWTSMRKRCNNPNHPDFKDYGGRGIKVCERWNDFTNFLADMGERPSNCVLDRYPNNDGNYEPNNCRWATFKESNKNRRPSKTRSDNHSGFTGVFRYQYGRSWQAAIRRNGKRIHLGIFDTPEAAHAAYCEAAKRLYGEFFHERHEGA